MYIAILYLRKKAAGGVVNVRISAHLYDLRASVYASSLTTPNAFQNPRPSNLLVYARFQNKSKPPSSSPSTTSH